MLIEGFHAVQVIANKAYESNAFIACIEAVGSQPLVPPLKTRRQPRLYDQHAYRERYLIEWLFNRLEQFRRIATRYEKLALNFLPMPNLATAYIWLA